MSIKHAMTVLAVTLLLGFLPATLAEAADVLIEPHGFATIHEIEPEGLVVTREIEVASDGLVVVREVEVAPDGIVVTREIEILPSGAVVTRDVKIELDGARMDEVELDGAAMPRA